MELPHVEVTPTAPITIHGVSRQLAPRILQCNKGGFLIILDDKVGIAACTEWTEAVRIISDIGRDAFGLHEAEPVMPKMFEAETHSPRFNGPSLKDAVHGILMLGIALGGLFAVYGAPGS